MSEANIEVGRCPFAATLVRQDFGCDRAIEVVRRGGSEIGCTDAAALPDINAWRAALRRAGSVTMSICSRTAGPAPPETP